MPTTAPHSATTYVGVFILLVSSVVSTALPVHQPARRTILRGLYSGLVLTTPLATRAAEDAAAVATLQKTTEALKSLEPKVTDAPALFEATMGTICSKAYPALEQVASSELAASFKTHATSSVYFSKRPR